MDKTKKYLMTLLIGSMLILPVWAEAQTKDDPIYIFASILTEIAQVFLSMWRVVYVTFEVFSLIFIFLIIPVLIFKTIKWGIKEVFGK